jgi:hypothetical protein
MDIEVRRVQPFSRTDGRLHDLPGLYGPNTRPSTAMLAPTPAALAVTRRRAHAR